MKKIAFIFKEVLRAIKESMYGPDKVFSHTKISSYFILGSILFFNFVCAMIDVINGIIMWKEGGVYHIPTEHIFVYSLTLTHHLVLLGLKRGSETDYINSKIKMEEISQNRQLTNDNVTIYKVPDVNLNNNTAINNDEIKSQFDDNNESINSDGSTSNK